MSTNTKKVRITLAALTRVEYSEVVEVPADMTEEELDALVDQRYEDVDGGDYNDDPHYWEPAPSCGHAPEEAGSAAQRRVTRQGDRFVVTDLTA